MPWRNIRLDYRYVEDNLTTMTNIIWLSAFFKTWVIAIHFMLVTGASDVSDCKSCRSGFYCPSHPGPPSVEARQIACGESYLYCPTGKRPFEIYTVVVQINCSSSFDRPNKLCSATLAHSFIARIIKTTNSGYRLLWHRRRICWAIRGRDECNTL